MTIFFTADPHLGHENLRRHLHRPFQSMYDTDDAFINTCLKQIKSQDTVYCLGDLAWARWYWWNVFPHLPGNWIFVAGNHDHKLMNKDQRQVKLLDIKIEKQHITLCHYPLLSWYKSRYGAYHFHGHCHGSLLHYHPCRIDVGWDVWNYRLVSYKELQEKIKWNLKYWPKPVYQSEDYYDER